MIVEVQCEIEPDKPERWPEYGIAYVPVVGQQIVLVVLALDRSVIRWVRKILRTLRSTVKIILLTPRKIPRSPKVDPETQPHRALLEAMVHVRDRRQLSILVRALRALEHVEATEHVIYREMLVSRIEEPLIMAAYEQLQANETYDDYVLDRRELKSFLYVRGHRAGVEAGELAGRARAVIELLHDRGLPTTPELEASLLGCRDPVRLRRALVRAATIEHADALLLD
ncbi:hypothetical protein ACNOYE_37315 [Nannocystaceae bacterium ST9]